MRRIRATAIVLTGALSIFATLPVAHAAADVAPVSDEFNAGSLDTSLWTVQSPLGDASVVDERHRSAARPFRAGRQHDLWPGSENALRVVQTISNGNFEVATKFDSMGSGAATRTRASSSQQNASTFLRFDVYSTGSGVTVFSAASISGATRDGGDSADGRRARVHRCWLRVNATGST